jgi:DNA-binding transcriptional LysR family regulator
MAVTLSTPPAAWLVPRLGGFSRQHPAIEIRVDSSVRPVDLLSEPVDVALRHEAGDYRLCRKLLARPQKRLLLDTIMQRVQRIGVRTRLVRNRTFSRESDARD